MELKAFRFSDKKPRNNQVTWVQSAKAKKAIPTCYDSKDYTWNLANGNYRYCKPSDLWAPVELPILVRMT